MGIFDSIFGGGGGSSSGNATAAQLADLSKQLWADTAPTRNQVFYQLQNFMQGGWDPTQSRLWDPLKSNVESQFSTARNNIMSNVPAGGPLLESLADTETSKANTLSGLAGNMIQDMYNKAYGTAMNSSGTALSGTANAGNLFNQAYSGGSQNQMANAGGLTALLGLGSGLGSGLSGLGGSLAGLLGAGGMFFSSKDYKDDIASLPEGTALDVRGKIRPVSYKYKPEFGGEEALGVIAEEIEKVLPVAVKRKEVGGKKYTMVDYMALVPLLVKGLQEQQRQIDSIA